MGPLSQSDFEGFGSPEISLPGEDESRTRGRMAQRNLDADLGKIKRKKRFGLVLMALGVLFVATFLVPVSWVALYRFIEAPGTVLMLGRAADGERIRHTPVKITEISPHVIRAVIAAED